MSCIRIFICLTVIIVLSACASKNKSEQLSYSKQVPLGAQKTFQISLPRRKLEETANRGGGINAIRLVRIYRRAGQQMGGDLPQYRIFDLQPGSVFELMGLRNTDVLVAANDQIVYEPEGFRIFATQVLKTQQKSSVNIVREGISTLLEYSIVD